MKKRQKIDKKGTKKGTQPRKKLKFCMTNWKSSYVRGFKWKIENRPGKLSEGYLTRVNLYKTGYEHTAIIMQATKINSMPNGNELK